MEPDPVLVRSPDERQRTRRHLEDALLVLCVPEADRDAFETLVAR